MIKRFISKTTKQTLRKVATPPNTLIQPQISPSKAIDTLFGTSVPDIESLKKQSEFLKLQTIAQNQAILPELKKKKVEDNAIKISESTKSYSPTKIYYVIKHLKDINAIMNYYSKNKFYLTESHILFMLKRLSQLHQSAKTDNSNIGYFGANRPNKITDVLEHKRMADFVNNLEVNYLNYSSKNRLQILLFLAKINKKEFKAFIQQRLGLIVDTDIASTYSLKETLLMLWLCASMDFKSEDLLKNIDNTIKQKFGLIMFEKQGDSEPPEVIKVSHSNEIAQDSDDDEDDDDIKHERKSYEYYAKSLSLVFWAYNELQLSSEVLKMINLQLVQNDIMQRTSYNSLVNYLLSTSALNNKNKIKLLKSFSQRVLNDNTKAFSQMNDVTQINIIKSLSKLRPNHDYLDDCAQKLMTDILKQRKFMSAKNISLTLWHLSVFTYELPEKQISTLYKLLEQNIPNMNGQNATLVLYSIYKQIKEGRYIFGSNNDAQATINLIIDRLEFVIRNVNKRTQDFLIEMSNGDIKEFKRLRDLVKYFN